MRILYFICREKEAEKFLGMAREELKRETAVDNSDPRKVPSQGSISGLFAFAETTCNNTFIKQNKQKYVFSVTRLTIVFHSSRT